MALVVAATRRRRLKCAASFFSENGSPAPIAVATSTSDGSSSSSESCAEPCVSPDKDMVVEGPEERAWAPLCLPLLYDGCILKDDPYTDHMDPSRSHRRLITSCTTHERCNKRRGRGLNQTRRHGEWEPVAFLIAWQRRARVDDLASTHVRDNPSVGEVDMVVAELRERFAT